MTIPLGLDGFRIRRYSYGAMPMDERGKPQGDSLLGQAGEEVEMSMGNGYGDGDSRTETMSS